MQSTHAEDLDIPMPPKARDNHILPNQKNGSLISIGNICNEGYVAILGKVHLCIVAMEKSPPNSALRVPENQDALQGGRNPANGLWSLPFENDEPFNDRTSLKCNSMLARESLPDRIAFLYAVLFSLTRRTLCAAIDKGFLTTLPGLVYASVRNHLPKSIATAKVHLDQKIQGIQSNQPPALPPESPTDTLAPMPNQRRKNIYADYAPITGQVHSDQTGKFIVPYSRGMNYIFIVYHEECNTILAKTMRNKIGPEHKRANQNIHENITERGFKPQLQRLYN